MSLKLKNSLFITGMVLLFFGLWGVSFLAEGASGFSGLGKRVAISPDDETVVFSHFENGDASLYLVPITGGEAELLAEPEEGKSYIHPVFSPDGKKIVFIEQWEEEEQPLGELIMIDIESGQIEQLTNEAHHITDAAFPPDGDGIYFLQSSVYENYSPIASEQPHDFDIYHLDLQTKEVEQITDRDAYMMANLAVTPDGDSLMYHSLRNEDVIAFYSPENKGERTFVPHGEDLKEPIISSPVLSADGKRVAFSGVADHDENGTFIYEGFEMDLETRQAVKMTSFREHVASLAYFHDDDQLVVTVDNHFAGAEPAYHYWIVDPVKNNQKRLNIQIPEGEF